MKPDTIIKLYEDVKSAALDSGLVEEVVLATNEDQIAKKVEDMQYRTLFLVADSADIMTEDDTVSFTAVVLDKSSSEEADYLYSVNDGVSVFKEIYDYTNYADGHNVGIGTLDIGSVLDSGKLLVSITTVITFYVTYLPNIKKIYAVNI